MKILLLLVLVQAPVFAWEDHATLTRVSLSPLEELKDRTLIPTSIETLLEKLGYASHAEFNIDLKIHKARDKKYKAPFSPPRDVSTLR